HAQQSQHRRGEQQVPELIALYDEDLHESLQGTPPGRPGLDSRMKTMPRFVSIFALVLGLAAPLAFAQLPVVPGEYAKAPQAAEKQAQVLVPKSRARALKLAPITESEIEVVRQANQRNLRKKVMIGADRAVDRLPAARELDWVAVDGARAAQIAVTSPQAA